MGRSRYYSHSPSIIRHNPIATEPSLSKLIIALCHTVYWTTMSCATVFDILVGLRVLIGDNMWYCISLVYSTVPIIITYYRILYSRLIWGKLAHANSCIRGARHGRRMVESLSLWQVVSNAVCALFESLQDGGRIKVLVTPLRNATRDVGAWDACRCLGTSSLSSSCR